MDGNINKRLCRNPQCGRDILVPRDLARKFALTDLFCPYCGTTLVDPEEERKQREEAYTHALAATVHMDEYCETVELDEAIRFTFDHSTASIRLNIHLGGTTKCPTSV